MCSCIPENDFCIISGDQGTGVLISKVRSMEGTGWNIYLLGFLSMKQIKGHQKRPPNASECAPSSGVCSLHALIMKVLALG